MLVGGDSSLAWLDYRFIVAAGGQRSRLNPCSLGMGRAVEERIGSLAATTHRLWPPARGQQQHGPVPEQRPGYTLVDRCHDVGEGRSCFGVAAAGVVLALRCRGCRRGRRGPGAAWAAPRACGPQARHGAAANRRGAAASRRRRIGQGCVAGVAAAHPARCGTAGPGRASRRGAARAAPRSAAARLGQPTVGRPGGGCPGV